MMEKKSRDHCKERESGKLDQGRRGALKRLGATTVAAALSPMILPSRLLAQKTVASDTPPPSERLSIALVGLGSAMTNQLRTLLPNKDIFIHAVCDVDTRRLKEVAVDVLRAYRRDLNEYGKCLSTQDHNEIMARDDIDGVVVATPVHWNAAITLDAIRSGKDVLCQSPMTLTVREGQLVQRAAAQHGAIVQCVAPQRCEEQMVRMCELVRNGYLGEIKQIYVEFDPLGGPDAVPQQKPPEELDYDRWLGPAPWAHYHSARVSSGRVSGWRQYWDYGARNHGEIGFGRYDLIQWALDMEGSGPVKFTPRGIDGAQYSTFTYDKGPQVLLGHPVERDQDIEFFGTQGRVTANSKGQLHGEPPELARAKPGASDQRLPLTDTPETSWIESVKTRSKPIADANVGHRSSTICHLNVIAERLGRSVTWDPAKEEIVGDPVASRMLDRPRRAPYTLV